MKQIQYKLLEVATRSLFVLSTLYFFPVELAGKLAFLILLFGFFTIIYGFERYISLQREIITKSDETVYMKLASLFRFYLFNFIITTPILIILLYNYGIKSASLITCCLIISFAEHISNAVYNISVVYNSFLIGMPIIIFKNILLVILAVFFIVNKQENPIEIIIYFWSTLSLIQLLIFSKWFMTLLELYKIQFFNYSFSDVMGNYKIAKINFIIGLISVLALQCDRLIVGYSLDSYFTGIYFRHVSLISILYQLFNIVSYNRLVPKIFFEAKSKSFSQLRHIIYDEFKKISLILFVMTVLFLFSYNLFLKPLFSYFQLNIWIVLALLGIFYIKIFADSQGMILNALHLEIKLCLFQVITLICSIILMLLLIPSLQVGGILIASFIGTLVYATVIFLYKPSLQNIY